MGWSFANDRSVGKNEIVASFRKPGFWSQGTDVIKDSVVGNHYWAVIQRADGERFIFLAMMQPGSPGLGWGYKDLDESMHPYYYDCPLGLLALAGPTSSKSAQDWRAGVRDFHESRRKRQAVAKPGLVMSYGGQQYRLIANLGRRGWDVDRIMDGAGFRMKARQVNEGLRTLLSGQEDLKPQKVEQEQHVAPVQESLIA